MIKLNGTKIPFETFPNGETKIDEKFIISIVGEDRHSMLDTITLKYESDNDLFYLYLLTSFIRSIKNKDHSLCLDVTYFPYSRMDRVEDDSAFTLKYVTDFINSMNFVNVAIFEPHSDVTPALLNNVETLSLIHHFIPNVVNEINFDANVDYIVFPDATANKRYSSLNAKNTLTGLKHRNFETGKIESLELAGQKPEKGFKALMVDDLCSYGGTFMMTAEKLKEMGASEIYLFVGHCEDNIFKGKVLLADSPIDKVFTTDSLITQHEVWSNKQFLNNNLYVFSLDEMQDSVDYAQFSYNKEEK